MNKDSQSFPNYKFLVSLTWKVWVSLKERLILLISLNQNTEKNRVARKINTLLANQYITRFVMKVCNNFYFHHSLARIKGTFYNAYANTIFGYLI